MATVEVMRLPGADEKEHHRFDYKGMHRYYITMPFAPKAGFVLAKGPILKLLGILREACWKTHFDLYAYCFLPDRMVMIVRGKTEYSEMKPFLHDYRHASSAALLPGGILWSKKYQERVLRKKEDSTLAALALFQLPVKEGFVSAAGAWEWQGSFVKDFTDKKKGVGDRKLGAVKKREVKRKK